MQESLIPEPGITEAADSFRSPERRRGVPIAEKTRSRELIANERNPD
jgi:hypothetical protein